MDKRNSAISFITLGVSDLAKMQTFYFGLGFELHAQSDSAEQPYAMYKSGGIILALYPQSLLAKQAGISFDDKTTLLTSKADDATEADNAIKAISISLNVGSREWVDKLLNTAKQLGAEVTREGFEPPWGGYCGYFKDPENNLWEIVWHENYDFSDKSKI